MDQDSAFMSLLINYLFKKLDIKIKTVAPYNHQSLQAEHEFKSLSAILNETFDEPRSYVATYSPLATFTCNTFKSPSLANYSPYELVFGRKLKLFLNLEMTPDIKVWGTFKDYYNLY